MKASDLAPNPCGMSAFDLKSLVGEIDVLRSDEYKNLPGCLDGVQIPRDQLNTVIHEVIHMVLEIPVTEEAKVVAISEVIQPQVSGYLLHRPPFPFFIGELVVRNVACLPMTYRTQRR